MRDLELIKELASRLFEGGIESARFEAKQITEFAENREQAIELCEKRISGEPLQYLLGEWEFYGLPFYVGEGVLIPRADTETLVDAALEIIGDKPLRVADLCSGSGAVAIAVAKNSSARVTALEKSEKAFGYLERNVIRNGADVQCIAGDLFEDLEESFDLILSNPPYIASSVVDTLSKEVKKEPRMALDGGTDGLDFYKRLTSYWKTRINAGGSLAVEIGYDQAESVVALFEQNGFEQIRVIKDLSGNNRVIVGTVNPLAT